MESTVKLTLPKQHFASRDADFPKLPQNLFPLPLTPMEHFFVVDDSPTHPMLATVQLTFQGSLEVLKLEKALNQSLKRNPLLSSRITPGAGSWQWVHDGNWKPTIRSLAESPPIVDGRPEPLNLLQEPGMRVWLGSRDDKSTLLFQFHHACVDGIGIRRFIVDFLINYTRCFAKSQTSIAPRLRLDRLDPERLIARGCLQQVEQMPATCPLTSWQRAKNLFYFFFQPPHPLERTPKLRIRQSSNSQVITQQARLDEHDSDAILKRASENGVKLDELGLALLFHTCRRWQRTHCSTKANRRIRLLTPYDLRGKDDLLLSAANRISFTFLGRTHRQCTNWAELLRGVQDEMISIKDSKVYADFLLGLRSGLACPAIMKWAIRKNQNMATAVFSFGGNLDRRLSRNFTNEGGYMRIGNALLQDVMAAPPVRANTNIAIGLCMVNQRICISAAWNREVLTESDAAKFLHSFADAWRQWGLIGLPEKPTAYSQIANAA